MVLEGLGQSLRGVLKKIAGASHIDEALVKEITRDIQRALLQSDVNVKLVLELTKNVERRALNEKPPAGTSPKEHVIRIIYNELTSILGEARPLPIAKQTIMMVGLYGQGKTTTTGKLGRYFNKKGLKVGVIAADVYRPAAYDQLKQIAEKVGISVYGEPGVKDAARIVANGMREFQSMEVIIIDTSGRHSLEADLIDELKRIADVAKPDERILVLDASVGQQAGPQAKAFHDAVGVTSVIITKMDGTAKGGGALSAVAQTNASIVFIGTGEHLVDLEPFDPTRFISRLLGMGDLQTLLEAAKENISEEQAMETVKKMMGGRFTLKEMYSQMEMLTSMGPLQKIMSMLPGIGNMQDKLDMEQSQAKLQKFKVIMDSMTDEEMEDPKIIKSSRVNRIARGAGVDTRDVRELLRQFNMSKKAMKGFMGNRKLRKQLMKQLSSEDMAAFKDQVNP
ncbi:MAG TPA: signal recognition particle protein Srp54 [Methanomassiliicoccaceae archaeon]|jgi:signal recognition particle subunit SRP54|nr:signal recognition particle protein [Euryarchaeota archaeon]HOB37603.1 signal recognition particle protein Srp54 [Methanomassiliicoccaceae archaeon]HOK28199.1 signal recognition particle protein Srp54 [Methanomassiliicoccaceae archaeon]HPT73599.1 signal recognition particle protein Srp54 [Methanomassiliicoccaceae archaeon]HQA21384.1 signal recognition particle protein Srp54 [Methanomassiliicoccaceae archaeon]